MPPSADTLAALATPVGTAALAVIRVSGPEAGTIAAVVGGGMPEPRRARRVAYRDRHGALLDDVVATFFAGPRSYTGEDVLEISSHGNPWLVQCILEDLHARGCRPAEPGEFTRRAFLNGRMDLSQAEAVMDVIAARSERALAAAHRLLAGGLGQELRTLTDRLVRALAQVEAYIDFPEEDLPAEDRVGLAQDIAAVRLGASRLLATRRYGDLLREGIKTVIVGEPNVGKSSLLNRLVGRERALVSQEPGTTRDYLEASVVIGPHHFRLIDTAGLNPAPGAVERLGMLQTQQQTVEADILLVLLDASRPVPPLVGALFHPVPAGRLLFVINKIDLTPAPHVDLPAGATAVPVSALTGAGWEELRAALVQAADGLAPEIGSDGIAINARHALALTQAEACLADAAGRAATGDDPTLLASDLRGALSAFGEIGGVIDHERVLDVLFASFCIGK